MNRLISTMEEDLAMVKALAVAVDQLLVTTVELEDIMQGIARTLLQHVTIASPTIIL